MTRPYPTTITPLTPRVVCLLAAALLMACAGKPPAGGQDGGQYCENEEDCPAGSTCESNVCVAEDGGVGPDAAEGDPQIVVDPMLADFGGPVLGSEVVLPVTIFNTGVGTLTIIDINIAESDPNPEYTYDPPANMSIPPGGSEEMSVALRPVDDTIDVGQLLITSNDPATPTVTVQLLSEWKGIVDLAACVETGDPAPDDCENPHEVSYGTVTYGTAASRTFYVWNAGDGNKLITVQDVHIDTTAASHDPLYTVELFEMVENPPGSGNWEESPVTLPFLLAPLGNGLPPTELHGRVTFTANTDGFKILDGDSLVITTNNTDDPVNTDLNIPITGLVDGCPAGLVDLNNDPTDGCEYPCQITQGGVEICDNVDNDCDGFVDSFTEGCYTVGDGGCQPDGTGCLGVCQGGTRTCTNGTYTSCVGQVGKSAEVCDDLDNDCDGAVNEGLDVGADLCTSAIDLGFLNENTAMIQVTGYLSQGGADWYEVTFWDDTPDPSQDDFNANVWFPPGNSNFRMDIHTVCGGGVFSCGSGGVSQSIDTFHFDAAGEDASDCIQDSSCQDHTIHMWIKVYRINSAAGMCESYTLNLENG